MEDLPDPVVPLGEGLVLADVSDVEAAEGEEVGAAQVAGGEAPQADSGAAEDSGGQGGRGVKQRSGSGWLTTTSWRLRNFENLPTLHN